MFNKILKLVVLSCCCTAIFAQVPNMNKKMPIKKMYQDFDTLIKIIESGSPYLVRKKSINYDMVETLKAKRSEIKDIKNCGDFATFLNRCLSYTMAQHARATRDFQYNFCSQYIDTHSVKIFFKKWGDYWDIKMQNQIFSGGLGEGFWHQGYYYIYGIYKFMRRYTPDTTIVTDFRILKRDEKPIDIFKGGDLASRGASKVKWDYQTKEFYVARAFLNISAKNKNRILVEDYPTKEQYEIPLDSCNISAGSGSLSEEEYESFKERWVSFDKIITTKVAYYDSLHLLYIYVGEMVNDGGAFADSVKKVAKGKQIDKMIIDVRDNPGGSDYGWANLVSAIIKNPLHKHLKLGVPNNPLMKKVFDDVISRREIPQSRIKIERIPCLDNIEFLTINSEGLIENGDTLGFFPDSNSLNYEGKIYVLQNGFCASSAGSFLSFSQQQPQFITVGEPVGTILGIGFEPPVFQLPNSKFTFQMDVFVELTDAQNATDIWRDRSEIELYPTIDEIIEYNNYRILDLRSDEFLFKHDWLFKKVLNLP
jgi:hypothetical protein